MFGSRLVCKTVVYGKNKMKREGMEKMEVSREYSSWEWCIATMSTMSPLSDSKLLDNLKPIKLPAPWDFWSFQRAKRPSHEVDKSSSRPFGRQKSQDHAVSGWA